MAQDLYTFVEFMVLSAFTIIPIRSQVQISIPMRSARLDLEETLASRSLSMWETLSFRKRSAQSHYLFFQLLSAIYSELKIFCFARETWTCFGQGERHFTNSTCQLILSPNYLSFKNIYLEKLFYLNQLIIKAKKRWKPSWWRPDRVTVRPTLNKLQRNATGNGHVIIFIIRVSAIKNRTFQMSMSSTKRKLEASEEDSLSRKRIPLNLDSNLKSLADSANSDSGVSRAQLEEQVWMVQWYNLIDLSKMHFHLFCFSSVQAESTV